MKPTVEQLEELAAAMESYLAQPPRPCWRRYVNGTLCVNPEPCKADHSQPDPLARVG